MGPANTPHPVFVVCVCVCIKEAYANGYRGLEERTPNSGSPLSLRGSRERALQLLSVIFRKKEKRTSGH